MLRNLVLDIGALLLGNIVAHLGSHRTAHFPVDLGGEEINYLAKFKVSEKIESSSS